MKNLLGNRQKDNIKWFSCWLYVAAIQTVRALTIMKLEQHVQLYIYYKYPRF